MTAVRPLLRIALLFAVLLIPATSLAFEQTVWDFRGEQLPGSSWRYAGIETPEKTPDGLLISAPAQDGNILADLVLSHPVEVIHLTFASPVERDVQFVWHRHTDSAEVITQLPITIPKGVTTIDLNVDFYRQWDRQADAIGFIFPQGTEVLLQEIRFSHWAPDEQAIEMMKSFWTFDAFSPFNINFVWGPLIAFNPVGTAQLFDHLPPQGRSGMWIFYVLLAAIAVVLVADMFHRKRPLQSSVLIFLLSYGALWMVFDVRMGAEMLSYVKHDYDTYLSKPHGQKIFRTYLNFNDVMEVTAPWLEGVPEFAVVRGATPITAMARYFGLPSVAVEVDGPRPDLPVWLIYHRDDVAVDAEGRLSVNGVPWSAPGKIVQQFDTRSFLFVVNP